MTAREQAIEAMREARSALMSELNAAGREEVECDPHLQHHADVVDLLDAAIKRMKDDIVRRRQR